MIPHWKIGTEVDLFATEIVSAHIIIKPKKTNVNKGIVVFANAIKNMLVQLILENKDL